MRGTKQQKSPSELFRYLSAKWPEAFNPKAPRPLKVGIRHDIRALDGELSNDELSTAMRAYTKMATYLSKLRAGAVRVDLSGKPAGEVSETEAASAKAQLRERRKLRAEQTPPPQKAAAELQSKPTPGRASTLTTKIATDTPTGVVVETKRRRSFQKPGA